MRFQYPLRYWFYLTLLIGVALLVFTSGPFNAFMAEVFDSLFGTGWGAPRVTP